MTRQTTRTLLGILLLMILVAGVYALREYTRQPTSIAEAPADFDSNPESLLQAFEAHEQSASKQFLGKVIRLRGKIKSVDKDPQGFLTLVLGNPASNSSVRCSMEKEGSPVKQGDLIVVQGICTGFSPDEMGLGADVLLNRCVLVETP